MALFHLFQPFQTTFDPTVAVFDSSYGQSLYDPLAELFGIQNASTESCGYQLQFRPGGAPDEVALVLQSMHNNADAASYTAQKTTLPNEPTPIPRLSSHQQPQATTGAGFRAGRLSRKGAKRQFPCPDCDKIYTRSEHLQRHQLNRKNTFYPPLRHRLPSDLNHVDQNKEVYHCPDCQHTFVRKDLFLRHLKRHSSSRFIPRKSSKLTLTSRSGDTQLNDTAPDTEVEPMQYDNGTFDIRVNDQDGQDGQLTPGQDPAPKPGENALSTVSGPINSCSPTTDTPSETDGPGTLFPLSGLTSGEYPDAVAEATKLSWC